MPRLHTLKRSWIYAASAISIILVLLFLPSSFSGMRSVAMSVFLGPVKGLGGVGVYFSSKRKLTNENARLKKELAELSLKTARFDDLVSENERLLSLLGFRGTLEFDTISAKVIARDPNDWLGSFVIDKGASDGVARNSAVCSSEGLLGKVVEPGEDISPVMLLTHPAFKAGGMIKSSRVNGIVVGQGKGKAKMMYIPVDSEAKVGDIVVTSEYSRIFPKGIPIGRIVSVEKSRTGLYKNANIVPLADPLKQEEVLCVK